MNNENINSNLEQAQINLNNGKNKMNGNKLNEKSYRACYVCSYCKNCYYDSEGIPRCRADESFDISENGEMADCIFTKDPDFPCDCADFDGIDYCEEPDPEEPDYGEYNGRYDDLPLFESHY